MRLTSVAVGLAVLAVVLALEFWGTTLRFEFGLPQQFYTLTATSLDPNAWVTEIPNGYNISIYWVKPYFKDYVELNISFRATANVTLTFDIYEVTGLHGSSYYYLIAYEYCYIRVPGYVYSPGGCSDLEVELLRDNTVRTATYQVIGSAGSYLVIRVRINSWGVGSGTVKLRVTATLG